MKRIASLLLGVMFTIVWTAISAAQTPPAGPRFGLGDYMTAFVQPRHMKLGLAGHARNWDYLAYERSELDETFEMIEKQVPRYKGTSMAELLKLVDGPMEELDKAIKARDGARFDAAYARLTGGCNACHATTEHRMVVIQAPKESPFANQKLTP